MKKPKYKEKTSIKIEGIRKRKSLDDLAKETAIDDKDLIEDSLQGNFNKIVSANLKHSSRFLVYSLYDLERNKGIDIPELESHKIKPCSALFAYDFNSNKHIFLASRNGKVKSLKWIQNMGLFDCGEYCSNKLLPLLFDKNVNIVDSVVHEFKDSINLKTPIHALEWIPNCGLIQSYFEGLNAQVHVCMEVKDSNYALGHLEHYKKIKDITKIKWIQNKGLFVVSNNLIFFNSQLNYVTNKQNYFSTDNISAIEWIPQMGLVTGGNKQDIINCADKTLSRCNNIIYKSKYDSVKIDESEWVNDLKWIPKSGLYAAINNRIVKLLDKNLKKTYDVLLDSDYEITALESISNQPGL